MTIYKFIVSKYEIGFWKKFFMYGKSQVEQMKIDLYNEGLLSDERDQAISVMVNKYHEFLVYVDTIMTKSSRDLFKFEFSLYDLLLIIFDLRQYVLDIKLGELEENDDSYLHLAEKYCSIFSEILDSVFAEDKMLFANSAS